VSSLQFGKAKFRRQTVSSRLQSQGMYGLSASVVQPCYSECYYEGLNGLNAVGNDGCTEWGIDEHGKSLTHLNLCSLQDGRVQVYRRVVQEETIGCPPLSPPCSVSSSLFDAIFLLYVCMVTGAGNTAN